MAARYRVGSLFAGVGGIELGFQQVNNGQDFEILWANEFDENACRTYRLNFGHELFEQDVHELDAGKLPAVDVLTAGFPCQAFSVAGYREGFRDPRGNLFFEIMRVIEELPEKPRVLFLENVKNFYGHDDGKTYKIVKQALESHGYSVFTEILNTAEYTEIPHNRERTFIICFRDELGWALDNPKTTCSWVFDSLFPPPRSEERLHVSEMLEKGKADDRYYYGESVYMYDQLKEVMKSRDTVYQFRRKYVRENKSNLCPTLTANMGTGGHNVPLIIDDWGFRKLTPRECFRFQGFDDSFEFPEDVAMSQLYKQAGNSVSVPLIQRLAESVKKAMDEKYDINLKCEQPGMKNMKLEKRTFKLPEGDFESEFMFFDETDRLMLKKMFNDWVSLCKQSLKIGSTRIINFPEGLSEAIFAIDFKVGRSTENISGTSSSFDHYDFKNNKRIQLKAASSYAPSTFGPRSVYDEIYFMFLREIADSAKSDERIFSGKYEVYKIDPNLLPNIICNKKKVETFSDQQAQGKRPRFSIPNKLIEPQNLKPILTGDILSW